MASPEDPGAYVRLIAPAVKDLQRLMRVDPQIVRMALKKMLLLERNPNAGRPLLGNLIGWRKLTVGNRDWRIVWRVTTDGRGLVVLDIAEVWAVGARADEEVYAEVEDRLAAAGPNPVTSALSEVVDLLGRAAGSIPATSEPQAPDPLPKWLEKRLKEQVGLSDEYVSKLDLEQAVDAWTDFQTRGR